MSNRTFLNRYQPQQLQTATMLLYIQAVFGIPLALVLIVTIFASGGIVSPLDYVVAVLSLVPIAGGFGAYGIANERKWGFGLGVFAATVGLVVMILRIQATGQVLTNAIGLIIAIGLLAVVLSNDSRNYVKSRFH